MNLLKDKVVIVTGGTKGIGYATCKKAAEEGALVFACARHMKDFDDKEIKNVILDVTNFEECQNVIEEIYNTYGHIDGLVANAGIVQDAIIEKMSIDMFNNVLEVNTTGVFNIIKAVYPYLKEKQKGSIVAVSSIVGEFGNIGQINYSASKAALIGLIKSCAKEFARHGENIRANVIAPGYINTDMLKNVPQHLLDDFADRTMLKRLGQPEEIASVIVFLLSDEASYITGSVIDVNGGMRL